MRWIEEGRSRPVVNGGSDLGWFIGCPCIALPSRDRGLGRDDFPKRNKRITTLLPLLLLPSK